MWATARVHAKKNSCFLARVHLLVCFGGTLDGGGSGQRPRVGRTGDVMVHVLMFSDLCAVVCLPAAGRSSIRGGSVPCSGLFGCSLGLGGGGRWRHRHVGHGARVHK